MQVVELARKPVNKHAQWAHKRAHPVTAPRSVSLEHQVDRENAKLLYHRDVHTEKIKKAFDRFGAGGFNLQETWKLSLRSDRYWAPAVLDSQSTTAVAMPLHTASRADRKTRVPNQNLRRRSVLHLGAMPLDAVVPKKPKRTVVGNLRRTCHWMIHVFQAIQYLKWQVSFVLGKEERIRTKEHRKIVKYLERWWSNWIHRKRTLEMQAFIQKIGLNAWVYKIRIQVLRKRMHIRRIIFFITSVRDSGGINGRRVLRAANELTNKVKSLQRCYRDWKICTRTRLKVMRFIVEEVERTRFEELQSLIPESSQASTTFEAKGSAASRRMINQMADIQAKFDNMAVAGQAAGAIDTQMEAEDKGVRYRRTKTRALLQLLHDRRAQYKQEVAKSEEGDLDASGQPKKRRRNNNVGQFDMESMRAIMHGQRRFSAVFFGRKDGRSASSYVRPPFLFYTSLTRERRLFRKLVRKSVIESGYRLVPSSKRVQRRVAGAQPYAWQFL